MFKIKLKKKNQKSKTNSKLQLESGSEVKFAGIFTGLSVIVTDKNHSKLLYENGCYGKDSKPRCVPKPAEYSSNSTKLQQTDDEESLVLDLEESFFLSYVMDLLKIVDLNGQEISENAFLDKAFALKPNFLQTLIGFIYLKSKNWVVKSGIKFGGDFLIYKEHVKSYHASFLVIVCDESSGKPKDIQGIQRIAETSSKDVLFLEICPKEDIAFIHPRQYFNKLDKFIISEVIIKRFDFKQFVNKIK